MLPPTSQRRRREDDVAEITFERQARTPYSESYSIEEDGDAIGRVDIHFTPSSAVFATLCVPQDYDEDNIQDLIAEIDERLVLSTDPYRDDFVVTVWRGQYAGEYSEDEDLFDEEEESNGRAPHA
jgi:hypothetical protein